MKLKCYGCQKLKEREDFNKSSVRNRGVQDYCKLCLAEYRNNNRIQVRLTNKLYREKNKDKISKIQKKWRINNKDKVRELKKRDYNNNREKYNKIHAVWTKNRQAEFKQLIVKNYGGKCVRCNFTDWRALQVDHINGGGSKEKMNYSYYKKLSVTTDTSKYQLLCANCNWIKRYENNECKKV